MLISENVEMLALYSNLVDTSMHMDAIITICVLFCIGNIFICQQKSKSAVCEGDTDEDDDASSSAGVLYKIGKSDVFFVSSK